MKVFILIFLVGFKLVLANITCYGCRSSQSSASCDKPSDSTTEHVHNCSACGVLLAIDNFGAYRTMRDCYEYLDAQTWQIIATRRCDIDLCNGFVLSADEICKKLSKNSAGVSRASAIFLAGASLLSVATHAFP